ncbi:MAG: hypothetical protein NTU62_13255 [Spirochaetes bacterium]|nr:hypothetical protein [Spirochaetota bacterium]
MRRTVCLLAAVGILAFCTTGHAAIGPNGLGPNGLGPNGLGPNGLGPNGLGPNGLGPNGLGPNGLGPNGLVVNGLGPNGLGPNGLGPNGMDVNGLGPNGLGPNGLGPNGLVYVITPAGVALDSSGAVARDAQGNLVTVTSTFGTWFDADPVGAAQYMRYFARCAYDGETGIAWLDSTGKTWVWTGQYGLAMTSLKTQVVEPVLGEVRGRMTEDEGKWLSACVLAHVNIKGTHQYLSLRANPPNPEAQAAFRPTPGERWVMGGLGIFFGDLFATNPKKYSAAYTDFAVQPFTEWIDAALGRDCETAACTYVDPAGIVQDVLTYHMYTWTFHGQNMGIYTLKGTRTDPDYEFDTVTQLPIYKDLWKSDLDTVDYHPIFTLLPRFYNPENVLNANGPSWGILSRGSPIAETQSAPCASKECIISPSSIGQVGAAGGGKLTGLSGGQIVDIVHRYNPVRAVPVSPSTEGLVPDMNESFTALVRFSNAKSRNAALEVHTSQKDGSLRSLGAEVWPPTGSATGYTWLYVHPVYPFLDAIDNAGNASLKVRLAGAVRGEGCTGPKALRGDGETNTCAGFSIDWKKLRLTCLKRAEGAPACRGSLIYVVKSARDFGWRCVDGGAALNQCTAADAPDLDAVGFIPGKPYCMPAAATSFVGVCQ